MKRVIWFLAAVLLLTQLPACSSSEKGMKEFADWGKGWPNEIVLLDVWEDFPTIFNTYSEEKVRDMLIILNDCNARELANLNYYTSGACKNLSAAEIERFYGLLGSTVPDGETEEDVSSGLMEWFKTNPYIVGGIALLVLVLVVVVVLIVSFVRPKDPRVRRDSPARPAPPPRPGGARTGLWPAKFDTDLDTPNEEDEEVVPAGRFHAASSDALSRTAPSQSSRPPRRPPSPPPRPGDN